MHSSSEASRMSRSSESGTCWAICGLFRSFFIADFLGLAGARGLKGFFCICKKGF